MLTLDQRLLRELRGQHVKHEALAALVRWWMGHRPLTWSLDEHLDNPTVNANSTEPERALAAAAGALVRDLKQRAEKRR